MLATRAARSADANDEGFGLVEIVVSMFLLAALAIAFLPLLIQGLKASAANATLATATQLVNEQMELAQAKSPSCSAISSMTATTNFAAPRGLTIEVATLVGACPTGVGTVSVTTTAKLSGTTVPLATASTLVYVR